MEDAATTRSVGVPGRRSPECPADFVEVWLANERTAGRVLVTVWLATGSASPPHQFCPPWLTNHDEEEHHVCDRDRSASRLTRRRGARWRCARPVGVAVGG